MDAFSADVADLGRVILGELMLDADVPGEGVAHLLIGRQEGTGSLARSQSCEGGGNGTLPDSAPCQETGSLVPGHVHGGGRLGRPGVGADVVENLVVGHAETSP